MPLNARNFRPDDDTIWDPRSPPRLGIFTVGCGSSDWHCKIKQQITENKFKMPREFMSIDCVLALWPAPNVWWLYTFYFSFPRCYRIDLIVMNTPIAHGFHAFIFEWLGVYWWTNTEQFQSTYYLFLKEPFDCQIKGNAFWLYSSWWWFNEYLSLFGLWMTINYLTFPESEVMNH